MNLSNIKALNQFADNHCVKQQKTQVNTHVCNTVSYFPSEYTKSQLYNRKITALSIFITYQPLEIEFHPLKGVEDIANLSTTCNALRYNRRMSTSETVSQVVKERKDKFVDEVNQFINLFKYNNGEFKNVYTIINDINNGTIILHQDPAVLKEGVKPVFSNMCMWETQFRELLKGIKNNISPDELVDLASVAIEKTSEDRIINSLLVEIINKITSEDKLVKLASRALKKMSKDAEINQLLIVIKDNISSEDKLLKLASIAIEKMTQDWEITRLFTRIKDKISSEDKLHELNKLISTAIKKMSNVHAIKSLIGEIK